MAKRTKKVGILGKYSTGFGASSEDGRENRNQSTFNIHLQFLWKGHNDAILCWNLEMQIIQESNCQRSMDVINNCCSYCPKCYPRLRELRHNILNLSFHWEGRRWQLLVLMLSYHSAASKHSHDKLICRASCHAAQRWTTEHTHC